MQKLNLFIIGASKAGTTTLWEYLNQQPWASMGIVKEPCTFAFNDWLERIKTIHRDYDMSTPWRGEASTIYSQTHIIPDIAERIYDYNPSARIIYVVRNPIDRLYSVWAQTISTGHHYKNMYKHKTDSKSVEVMPKNFYKALWEYPLMIESCKYATHIKQYLDTFPAENIKLMFFEDLIMAPHTFYQEINYFLDQPSPSQDQIGIWLNKREEKTIPLTPKIDKISKLICADKVMKHFPKLKNNLKSILYPGISLAPFLREGEREEIQTYLKNETDFILKYGNKTCNYWDK
jgi:hypothetical protein